MHEATEYAILDLETSRILPHRWVDKTKAQEMLEKALDTDRFALIERPSEWKMA